MSKYLPCPPSLTAGFFSTWAIVTAGCSLPSSPLARWCKPSLSKAPCCLNKWPIVLSHLPLTSQSLTTVLHDICFPAGLGKSPNPCRLHSGSPADVYPCCLHWFAIELPCGSSAAFVWFSFPPQTGYGTRGKGGGQESHGSRLSSCPRRDHSEGKVSSRSWEPWGGLHLMNYTWPHTPVWVADLMVFQAHQHSWDFVHLPLLALAQVPYVIEVDLLFHDLSPVHRDSEL